MNGHCNHLALKFSVCVKERQDRLPTMYWLPKLPKLPKDIRGRCMDGVPLMSFFTS